MHKQNARDANNHESKTADSTGQSTIDSLTLLGWQKQELDRRRAEYLAGQVELFDWQIVHDTLRKTCKPA